MRVGVVYFGRNHSMCRDVEGFPHSACASAALRMEKGTALSRPKGAPGRGNGRPHPQPKASTHLEAAATMILRRVGSEDSNQQQGWCEVEGCGAVIGSANK